MSRFTLVVSVGLLLSIGLRFALPLIDRNAAEHDPWHTHIVIGARDLGEYEHALFHHSHELPDEHDSQTGSPLHVQAREQANQRAPQVISIASQPEGKTTALGIEIPSWLVPAPSLPGDWSESVWQSCQTPPVSGSGIHPLPPTPPPRASLFTSSKQSS
jgi:hypothetical protein